MRKWGRKELGAKINADPTAKSCAGWWMAETEAHTHKSEQKSRVYHNKYPEESYLSKLKRQEHWKCEKEGGKAN